MLYEARALLVSKRASRTLVAECEQQIRNKDKPGIRNLGHCVMSWASMLTIETARNLTVSVSKELDKTVSPSVDK